MLGERCGLVEAIAALLSFTGVVLVSNPTFESAPPAGGMTDHVMGCAIALTGAVCAAAAYVTVRSFGTQISFVLSVLSLGVGVTIGGIIMGGASWSAVRDHPTGFLYAVTGAVFGFIGQCLLNKGFQYCRAGTGTLMRNVDVPLAWLLGLIFLHEVPYLTSLIGSGLVLAGTILVGLKQIMAK